MHIVFYDIFFKLQLTIIVFYRRCDVIVEVCHPQIVKEFGHHFLSQSHFMVRFPSVCVGDLLFSGFVLLSLLSFCSVNLLLF